ncbi:cytochrome b/b6 domain-containing protein [Idiomarina sp. OT37-5b]|jgi:cytochrome b|uniref:cytochrome b/b6 domain-containing protein n=1 Tax=Idiomarina sp. OT37-5b TaxID=2100422 RepID=UPI0021CAF8E9|nr:cytochrome b/b6 domain-containing protein [Idiomarina sp. OT37-5b]
MSKSVVIWDAFIRGYHWLIVIAFVLNYFILEPGETVHQWVGYSAVTLVILRILWGFIGPRRALLSDFFPTPKRIAEHVQHLRRRQLPQRQGHNALGGLLIWLFWLLFLGQGFTGYLLEETDRFFGSSVVENIHEWLAHSLFAGVLVHLVAVIVVSWWGRIQLLRPMLTGKRQIRSEDD